MSLSDDELRLKIQTIPVCVIISGKRKCGKDHTVRILSDELRKRSFSHVVIHLSYPIKRQYAKLHGLDFSELSSSGPYKEIYRKDMVRWSEQKKTNDLHVFAREAVQIFLDPVHYTTDVVILADARRPYDLNYFIDLWDRSRCIIARVIASEATRKKRGWIFTTGVDDAETECALDGFPDWDLIIHNDSDVESCHTDLLRIIQKIEDLRRRS
ncbi:Phosphomevalonate kinase [Fasciola hepatica]|uniref:Phosphomevalonate kinase n=1 Tax=Fasciola hepatica TaxID=6192 RepID=A0A4E0QYB2_FASHE|nr:Phosphomevalonate kinase [Fasciola hepatica]